MNIKFAVIPLLFIASQIKASPSCDSADDCVTVGESSLEIAMGLGFRSNPLVDSDNIPLVLMPDYSYYGKRFFIDGLEMGLTLNDNDQFMVNVITTLGDDRLFFSQWDPGNVVVPTNLSSTSIDPGNTTPVDMRSSETLQGLGKRRHSIYTGIEWTYLFNSSDIQCQWLTDIGSVHKGSELRLAYSFYAKSPTLFLNVGLGLAYKSAKVINYYYGVDTHEVNNDRGIYSSGSGVNAFVSMTIDRPINERWAWKTSLQYKALSEEIANSTIVEEDTVITFFTGAVYKF